MRKGTKLKTKWRKVTAVALSAAIMSAILPTVPFSAANGSTSQTEYSSIDEFQKAKYIEMQNEIFEKKGGDTEFSAIQSSSQINSMLGTNGSGAWQVKKGNSYFNWVDNDFLESCGITPWDGTTDTSLTYSHTSRTETIDYSGTKITYTVYDVTNASELRYALSRSGTIKVNLLNDINLNGENQVWNPINPSVSRLYFEGNGHTIYNMRAYKNGSYVGFFGDLIGRLVVKNLNFKSAMSLGAEQVATLYGKSDRSNNSVYLYNVHADGGYVHANGNYAGGLLGRVLSNCNFIKSCSNSNYLVFGMQHTGGFSSLLRNNNSGSYQKYNAPFPKTPESITSGYGVMMEDCYSINSTVFSYSPSRAADSGGMVSCVSGLTARNCFTNNTMYGNAVTGAFVGRDVCNTDGYLYDDNNKRSINSYFENCYSTGSVEGQDSIGGFMGSRNGTSEGLGAPVVFKNCYSTAMVGMDYAGTNLGGFIGRDETVTYRNVNLDLDGDGSIDVSNNGSIYINCYAAGEVGNILTDTNPNTTNTNKLGGFVGGIANKNAKFVNCYYDMQTTAMRERGYGEGVNPEGIKGVYTQSSAKKGIQGLTYNGNSSDTLNVNMNDELSWSYTENYYPRLNVFEKTGKDSSFYVEEQTEDSAKYSVPILPYYDTDSSGKTIPQTYDFVNTVNRFSQASAATVFLNHWDSIMNTETGALPRE